MSNVGKAIFKRFFTLMHAYFSWILPYSRHPSKEPLNIKFKKLKKSDTNIGDKKPVKSKYFINQ